MSLFDGDFGAADRTTAEGADFAAGHFDDAVTRSMDGEVTAKFGAVTSALALADLAYDNLTGFDCLTTEKFDTEALALAVSSIFAGTASFNV